MAETPSPNELLERFLFVLFKYKWTLVGTFLLVMAACVCGVYLTEPAYKATAKILVRYSSRQQLIVFPDLETPGMVNPNVHPAHNLVEFSASRGMAETVVKKFGLDQSREPEEFRDYVKDWIGEALKSPVTLCETMGLLKEEPEEDHLAEAIDDLLGDVQDVEVQKDTEIISLSIWGPNPELATGIANTMAELLVEKTCDITRSQAEEAYNSVQAQVNVAETSLHEAEEELERFKRDQDIVSLKEERKLILDRLDNLRAVHTTARTDFQEAEAKLLELRGQLDGQEATVVASSMRAANAVAKEVRKSRNELSGKLAYLLGFLYKIFVWLAIRVICLEALNLLDQRLFFDLQSFGLCLDDMLLVFF